MVPEGGVSQCVGGEGALPGKLKNNRELQQCACEPWIKCKSEMWSDKQGKHFLEPCRCQGESCPDDAEQ